MQNTNLGTLNPNNYPVSSSINTNAPNIYPSNNPGSTINYGAAYPSSSVVNMPGVISGSNVGGISEKLGTKKNYTTLCRWDPCLIYDFWT